MRDTAPLLSVLVPAYQGARVLPRALAALAASDLPRAAWELIVIDDASTDGTDRIAAIWADVVIRLPGQPHGPSYARNRGAEVARGAILVTVDADVCVHPDALRRIAWLFLEQPGVSAVFGAYDTTPAAPGLVSQYRNLLHHYVHVRDQGDAETFWAGLGAVRAEAFHAVGMFDEWHFTRPQIEDIELGGRLRDMGHRILLQPDIQGTHLKRWRLRDVIRSDVTDRGVPWTRLLIERGEVGTTRTLNLRPQEKVNTALVASGILFAAAFLVTWDWPWLAGVAAVLVPVLAANRSLYRFFLRHRGMVFTLAVLPLHLAYYALNAVSAFCGWILHHVVGEPQPPADVQAFSEIGSDQWPPVPQRHTTRVPAGHVARAEEPGDIGVTSSATSAPEAR